MRWRRLRLPVMGLARKTGINLEVLANQPWNLMPLKPTTIGGHVISPNLLNSALSFNFIAQRKFADWLITNRMWSPWRFIHGVPPGGKMFLTSHFGHTILGSVAGWR